MVGFFTPFHWMTMIAFGCGVTDKDYNRGNRLMAYAVLAELAYIGIHYAYAFATRNAAAAITAD